MAKTKRVRVKPEDYKKISDKAEEEGITYAEAVHKLIEERHNSGFMLGMLAGAGISAIFGGGKN